MFFIKIDIISVNPPGVSLLSNDNSGGFQLRSSCFARK